MSPHLTPGAARPAFPERAATCRPGGFTRSAFTTLHALSARLAQLSEDCSTMHEAESVDELRGRTMCLASDLALALDVAKACDLLARLAQDDGERIGGAS